MRTMGAWLAAVGWLVGCAPAEEETGTTEDTGVERAPREQTTFVHLTACTGCEGFELWERAYDESSVLGMYPCFHEGEGLLFAEERWDAAIRALDVGTCELLDGEVLEVPHLDCLDAGTLVYSAGWEGWSVSPLDYNTTVRGYPAAVAFGEAVEHYAAGVEVGLDAAGGEDIAAFQVSGQSPEPVVLLSPIVDGDRIPDLDLAADLEVRWSGGEGETVRIWVLGEWVTPSSYQELLGCHAANDGSFTIPGDVLSLLDLGQVTQLGVSDRVAHPLPVPELADPAWTLGSLASTYVCYDPGPTGSR